MADLRYDAFISYSHTARSARIAEALQAGLQRFARPWYRGRAVRVFRDTTDLTATPQLWGDICTAMAQSSWFVLIASPKAAASRWVGQEVEWWLANKSADHLLPVLADGVLRWDSELSRLDPQASTAVPEELLNAYTQEPLWIDLTGWGSGSEPYSEASLERGVASIAARMRGVPLDAVTGEHLRQQRRTRRLVALVMSLLLALTASAVAASIIALTQRNEALRSADRAASRNLILQSATLRGAQVDRALLTGIGAAALDPGPRSRANLITTLAGSRYAGTLPGPSSGVVTARFAPMGRIAITTHVSGGARIWDVSDPARARLLSTIDAHGGAVRTAAFRPDGRLIALGGEDKSVTLWEITDPARPRMVSRLPQQRGQVWSVTFDPGGGRLFSSGDVIQGPDDDGVRVWDVGTPEQPRQVAHIPLVRLILDITVSPQTGVVAIAGVGGVWLWTVDGDRPRELSHIDAHQDTVYTAAFTPDGQHLVTGSQDRTVLLWDVAQSTAPREVARLPEFDKPVFACEISDDGRTLAVASGDGTVSTWNIADPARPALLARLPMHAYIVDTAVSFSADGALLMSGAGDGRALLWTTGVATAPVREQSVDPGAGAIRSIAVGPGDEMAAFGVAPLTGGPGDDGIVRLYQLPGDPLADLQPGMGRLHSLSPDGKTLLTGNHGVSYLWDVAEPTQPRRLAEIDVPALSVQDVAWSTDGSVLMLSGQLSRDTGGGAATLWNVTDRARPVLLPARGFGDRFISAAAMSPDGRTAALTSGQRLVLWDVTDRHHPHALAGSVASHPAVIRSVAFSPRGDVLATGSNDQTVALWHVPDGTQLAVLERHEQAVNTVAFTADTMMIAALDDSGVVTLWDVADPTLPVRLDTIPAERGNPATSMVLGRDGRRIFVGRTDGTVEMWDIGRLRDLTADPIRAACALTGRGLTESEWRTYVPERPFQRTC